MVNENLSVFAMQREMKSFGIVLFDRHLNGINTHVIVVIVGNFNKVENSENTICMEENEIVISNNVAHCCLCSSTYFM